MFEKSRLVPAPCPIHEKAHDRPHRVAPSGKPAGKRGVGRRISGTLACPGTTTDERTQRVLIELATEYEAIAEAAPRRRRVKHFSPPRLSGCDYLKHGAPSARGHVVKGHVARPARNPALRYWLPGHG
jgi:hypothetical protein